MSITDEIRARVAAHEGTKLFHLPLLSPGGHVVRDLFVSDDVRDAVMSPWPDNRDGLRLSGFRGDLDAFTAGDVFSVSEDPFRKLGNAMLARVDPVSDEVWDFRSSDPRPGIRCFGAFGAKDFFIALTWDYRENLDEPSDWVAEIENCKRMWSELFDALPRFRGDSLDEYISNYYAV